MGASAAQNCRKKQRRRKPSPSLRLIHARAS
jgi:hypothetical protein